MTTHGSHLRLDKAKYKLTGFGPIAISWHCYILLATNCVYKTSYDLGTPEYIDKTI